MGKNFKGLTAISPMLAAAGLAGAALLSPAVPAQSQNRDFGNYGQAIYGGSDLDAEKAAEATKAAVASNEEIVAYFGQISEKMDRLNPLAPTGNPYAARLAGLTQGLDSHDGLTLDIQAYLVDEVYAFALADGTVRVSSALMDAMNDDEVRCVIGHEIGHVKLEHGHDRMRRALRRDLWLSVANADNGGARRLAESKLDGVVQRVVYAPHSPAAETASDSYALGFMAAKGYNREACATAMDKLAARGRGGSIALLQTHPHRAARAKRMRTQTQ